MARELLLLFFNRQFRFLPFEKFLKNCFTANVLFQHCRALVGGRGQRVMKGQSFGRGMGKDDVVER